MNPVPLSLLLDKVTRRMGMAARLRQGLAAELWPRVAGNKIAHQTAAGPIRDRVLIVTTDNPVLAHQLSMAEHQLLQGFRKILGGQVLRGIHFQVGELPPRLEMAAEEEKRKEIPPELASRLQTLADAIPDQRLAASFLRAAKAWARINAPAANTGPGYQELMTGDSWPTALEVRRAWESIPTGDRDKVAQETAAALRRKILARLSDAPRSAAGLLALRGDLRRLAMVCGLPTGGRAREVATELLGPEAAALWPDE